MLFFFGVLSGYNSPARLHFVVRVGRTGKNGAFSVSTLCCPSIQPSIYLSMADIPRLPFWGLALAIHFGRFVAFIPFVSFASAHPRSPSSLGGSFFLLSISARLPLLNGVQRWASGGWEEIGKARNQLPCCRRRRSLVVRRRSLRLITHVQVSKSNSAGE